MILFPDPWPKARHEKRRLISYYNVNLILNSLKKKGNLYLATDVKNYFISMIKIFEELDNTIILNKENYREKPKIIETTRYMRKAILKKNHPYFLKIKKILD